MKINIQFYYLNNKNKKASSKILQKGAFDLVSFSMDEWNNHMVNELEKCELEKSSIFVLDINKKKKEMLMS